MADDKRHLAIKRKIVALKAFSNHTKDESFFIEQLASSLGSLPGKRQVIVNQQRLCAWTLIIHP